jgi:hypothetical protein
LDNELVSSSFLFLVSRKTIPTKAITKKIVKIMTTISIDEYFRTY